MARFDFAKRKARRRRRGRKKRLGYPETLLQAAVRGEIDVELALATVRLFPPPQRREPIGFEALADHLDRVAK